MKLRSRVRGPKLRVKLLLVAFVLLVVPWLTYVLLVEFEDLLLQGQKSGQIIVASSLASQFNNLRFDDFPVQLKDYEHLYARPLANNIMLDGKPDDWGERQDSISRNFGEGDGAFSLVLGENINRLFGLLHVNDMENVFRDRGTLTIDNADHVVISFQNGAKQPEEVALTFSEPGTATAYRMTPGDYRGASPAANISGHLVTTATGTVIEFEFPLAIVGEYRDFAVTYVDVDDPITREVRARTRTVPNEEANGFNLVIFRSAETANLLESMGLVDARVLVVDTQKRIRGESKGRQSAIEPSTEVNRTWIDFFAALRPFIHFIFKGEVLRDPTVEESQLLEQQTIDAALRGEPTAVRKISPWGTPSILAAHPVQSTTEILGAVIVEQDIRDILSFLQRAFAQILLFSALALAIVILVALGFSIRLAYRIQKLRSKATQVIDEHGRLKGSSIDAEINAGDEIGDLARTIDNMLDRLNQHQQFLQRMPRTLRHEINNPLNIVSTSLENLRATSDPKEQDRYVQSARRGMMRIGQLIQNLSDAASLEDALKNEELDTIDIRQLVENYIDNLQSARPDVCFELRGVSNPTFVNASGFHIEQLLDKVLDNAIDFHRPDSPIRIQLDRGKEHVRISVANRGPSLKDDAASLFGSLVSRRSAQSKVHFGLGLFVVRVIAEFHQGSVRAANLSDGSGVVVSVELPLAPSLQSSLTHQAVQSHG